jgi:lysozyme
VRAAAAGRPARTWRWAAASLSVVVGVLAVLVFHGIVWPNRIFAAGYEVKGVDVAHYQGEIDWERLASQGIDFAWIKATEGSSHVDPRFTENWRRAGEAGLLVGAYHFMSFESSGSTQAEQLARHVPATPGTLPPVIDLEFYGSHVADPPAPEQVRGILDDLVAGIERHYGTSPVLYLTGEAYDRYVAGRYPQLKIWIRSIALPPSLSDGRDWTFWQYSPRDRLDGYDGIEPYIDMNAFAGTRAELESMTLR